MLDRCFLGSMFSGSLGGEGPIVLDQVLNVFKCLLAAVVVNKMAGVDAGADGLCADTRRTSAYEVWARFVSGGRSLEGWYAHLFAAPLSSNEFTQADLAIQGEEVA